MMYGCGVSGHQICPIFGFWPIFPYTKPLKRTFRWPAYSPRVTSQNDSDFSMWSGRSKGVFFQDWRFPVTSDRGAGDPKTCPKFRLWQMTIPIQNATTLRVRSGPKMSENVQFWGRMYFSTKYLHPYPQNYPKTPFWGPFNANLLYRELSVCRALMELLSWNFTVI